jgi:hypothetical protein
MFSTLLSQHPRVYLKIKILVTDILHFIAIFRFFILYLNYLYNLIHCLS